MAPSPKKSVEDPQPLPGVVPGDEIYVQHDSGPSAGVVVCHGKHGATVKIGDKQHRVPWRNVLGHKRRAALSYSVVEEGEDGMIVCDPKGRRHYVGIPPEAREEKMMVKSFAGGSRVVLLTKSAPYMGAPGLTKKQVTDKNGVQTTRWVRSTPDMPAPNVGHHIGFVNGEHKGHGKVIAAGRDGVTVQDRAGGVHGVPHAAVTHRWEGGESAAPPGEGPHAAEEKKAQASPSAGGEGGLFDPAEIERLPKSSAQPVNDWDGLVKMGTEGLEQFRGLLGNVASTMGLVSGKKPEDLSPEDWQSDSGYLFIAPLKGEKRAREKVEADYHGEWNQLRDIVRATISVPTMAHVKQALGHIKAGGIELAQQPKNRFEKPTGEGYRDLMTIVKLPNGMLAELQVHVKSMTLAKEEGHEHYNKTRSLQAKYGEDQPSDKWSDEDHKVFYSALSEQRKIYGKAWAAATGGDKKGEEGAAKEPLLKSHVYSKTIIVTRRV